MTGYDVLRRVRMPRHAAPHDLVVPVALREDGTAFERDYRKAPMALTLGANHSGKSMYLRNLIKGLAQLPVALVGIDCKRGVEQRAFAPRLSWPPPPMTPPRGSRCWCRRGRTASTC